MAGPLRTFFRTNAGYPEDEPDMTDFLLDSMIRKSQGPGMPTVPNSTSPSRMMNPQMPGAPPQPRPMPQMRGQTWGDVLSQVLSGAGDVVSAGGGRPTNYLGQTMGLQQGLRGQQHQQALAQHAAIEQASRMAHEYEWRKYGAGQQEKRQSFSEEMKRKEQELYEKMLGKEKAKAEQKKNLFSMLAPETLKGAETVEDLDAAKLNLLKETGGDPELMAALDEAHNNASRALIPKIAARQAPGTVHHWLAKNSGAIGEGALGAITGVPGLVYRGYNYLSKPTPAPEGGFEQAVQAEYQKLQAAAPPISDPYGMGHAGRAQQLYAQAEAIVRKRMGLK